MFLLQESLSRWDLGLPCLFRPYILPDSPTPLFHFTLFLIVPQLQLPLNMMNEFQEGVYQCITLFLCE